MVSSGVCGSFAGRAGPHNSLEKRTQGSLAKRVESKRRAPVMEKKCKHTKNFTHFTWNSALNEEDID